MLPGLDVHAGELQKAVIGIWIELDESGEKGQVKYDRYSLCHRNDKNGGSQSLLSCKHSVFYFDVINIICWCPFYELYYWDIENGRRYKGLNGQSCAVLRSF